MLLGKTRLNWGDWVYGLIAGFVGGGATAVTSGTAASWIAPESFTAGSTKFFKLIAATFLINGAVSAFMFLKQHPLPDIVVEETVKRVEREGMPDTVVTTVKETKVVHPVDKPEGQD